MTRLIAWTVLALCSILVASIGTFGLQIPITNSGEENEFMPLPSDAPRKPPGAGPPGSGSPGSGVQNIWALCEVTGGGQKVHGIAIQYDGDIDDSQLTLDTFTTSIVPAAKGGPGMPADGNEAPQAAQPRDIFKLYTNSEPSLRKDQKSVKGSYVIAEFEHDSDPSLPTSDSDSVTVTQDKTVKSDQGHVYPATTTVWSNAARRGSNVKIRAVDDWEQAHWWWDDARSTWLEYSIYLPKSFLEEGGEKKSYPLVLAITHSGTYYGGTCLETLTEQCIATIWSLPEEQERNEAIVITPRYERTTLNDYWEHTNDIENTHRLVLSLLENKWNFGNPELADRADKVLKVDPTRVYATGWSMGAMTSLWLMSKHPETYAAGLIIAGQQRPNDVIALADQKVLIITGTEDGRATPWNDKCVPVWEKAGAKVTRPSKFLDPKLIFPLDDQQELNSEIEEYLAEDSNITYLTFDGVDHMGSARKFFYIKSARDWLFRQTKSKT